MTVGFIPERLLMMMMMTGAECEGLGDLSKMRLEILTGNRLNKLEVTSLGH